MIWNILNLLTNCSSKKSYFHKISFTGYRNINLLDVAFSNDLELCIQLPGNI